MQMARSGAPQQVPCELAGKRRFWIWREMFELDERYDPVRGIGKGAYGIVCSANDRTSQQRVAIKKIKRPFGNKTEAIRCLREVNLLRHIRHQNIIEIRGIMQPADYGSFNDVYVVYEFMDTDLHQIIRSGQTLTDDHHKFLVMQMLQGLKYLHSADVIHRDLKPSNLLLNENCDLKIADFGLARSKDCRDDMTQYVVTRWYRAPELLLMSPYNKAIDLWSVGCILGEMLQGAALFKGRDQMETLYKVVELVGKPTDNEMRHILDSIMKQFIQNMRQTERKVETLFPDANPLAVDLLSSLLQFDPARRPTAAEALAHPWFRDIRVHNAETIAPHAFAYEFDEDALDPTGIRDLMCREIQIWNRTPQHA